MKIDFYVINGMQEQAREQFTCRLIEKALGLGNRIMLRTRDADQSNRLDELLWTYRQDSFVPHSMDTGDSLTQVCINHSSVSNSHCDLLINLADSISPDFESYTRVAEIINDDPQQRTAGRTRFREYRERGHEVDSHNVG